MTKQEISDLRKNKQVTVFCDKTNTWGKILHNVEKDVRRVCFVLLISKDNKNFLNVGDYFSLRDLNIMY